MSEYSQATLRMWSINGLPFCEVHRKSELIQCELGATPPDDISSSHLASIHSNRVGKRSLNSCWPPTAPSCRCCCCARHDDSCASSTGSSWANSSVWSCRPALCTACSAIVVSRNGDGQPPHWTRLPRRGRRHALGLHAVREDERCKGSKSFDSGVKAVYKQLIQQHHMLHVCSIQCLKPSHTPRIPSRSSFDSHHFSIIVGSWTFSFSVSHSHVLVRTLFACVVSDRSSESDKAWHIACPPGRGIS
jgi:hypothetical protein